MEHWDAVKAGIDFLCIRKCRRDIDNILRVLNKRKVAIDRVVLENVLLELEKHNKLSRSQRKGTTSYRLLMSAYGDDKVNRPASASASSNTSAAAVAASATAAAQVAAPASALVDPVGADAVGQAPTQPVVGHREPSADEPDEHDDVSYSSDTEEDSRSPSAANNATEAAAKGAANQEKQNVISVTMMDSMAGDADSTATVKDDACLSSSSGTSEDSNGRRVHKEHPAARISCPALSRSAKTDAAAAAGDIKASSRSLKRAARSLGAAAADGAAAGAAAGASAASARVSSRKRIKKYDDADWHTESSKANGKLQLNTCAICRLTDVGGQLLTCSACRAYVHPKCLQLTVRSVAKISATKQFFCLLCKPCKYCHIALEASSPCARGPTPIDSQPGTVSVSSLADAVSSGSMIHCSNCYSVCHPDCLKPSMRATLVTGRPWFCRTCGYEVGKRNNKPLKEVANDVSPRSDQAEVRTQSTPNSTKPAVEVMHQSNATEGDSSTRTPGDESPPSHKAAATLGSIKGACGPRKVLDNEPRRSEGKSNVNRSRHNEQDISVRSRRSAATANTNRVSLNGNIGDDGTFDRKQAIVSSVAKNSDSNNINKNANYNHDNCKSKEFNTNNNDDVNNNRSDSKSGLINRDADNHSSSNNNNNKNSNANDCVKTDNEVKDCSTNNSNSDTKDNAIHNGSNGVNHDKNNSDKHHDDNSISATKMRDKVEVNGIREEFNQTALAEKVIGLRKKPVHGLESELRKKLLEVCPTSDAQFAEQYAVVECSDITRSKQLLESSPQSKTPSSIQIETAPQQCMSRHTQRIATSSSPSSDLYCDHSTKSFISEGAHVTLPTNTMDTRQPDIISSAVGVSGPIPQTSVRSDDHKLGRLLTSPEQTLTGDNLFGSGRLEQFTIGYPNVSEWNSAQVAQFFAEIGYANECKVFLEQEIDGLSLLYLTRADILSSLGLKLGPAVKIFRHIHNLQAAAYPY